MISNHRHDRYNRPGPWSDNMWELLNSPKSTLNSRRHGKDIQGTNENINDTNNLINEIDSFPLNTTSSFNNASRMFDKENNRFSNYNPDTEQHAQKDLPPLTSSNKTNLKRNQDIDVSQSDYLFPFLQKDSPNRPIGKRVRIQQNMPLIRPSYH